MAIRKIEITNDNNPRYYRISPRTVVFGRLYDNEADTIQIVRPEGEADSVCTLIFTDANGEVIDHIVMTSDEWKITSNVSQYSNVQFGFSFARQDGYIKNSEIGAGQFLPALKPDDFVPVPPEQTENLDYLIGHGFTAVKLEGNDLNFYNLSNALVGTVKIEGIEQIQTDMAEADDTKASYIKNKKVSLLENDSGYVDKNVDNLVNYYLKSEVYTKDEVYPKAEVYAKSETYSKDEVYPKAETYTKAETDTQIDAKVKAVNAVKIRNTEAHKVIEATDSTVQTVATKYIQDNYSREPEELDGLFITFTDHDNDVVEYDYFNGFWQDTGRNGVDLSDYASLTEENTFTAKQNFNVETEFNGVAEHNADINVNDSTLNVVDTTNDTVTKYGATSIKIGNNEVKLPSSSGQLVLSDDLNKVDDKSNYYFAGAVPTTDDKFSIVGGSNAKSNGTGNIVYGARTEGSADRINDDGTTDYAQSIVIGNYSSSNGINTQVLGDNARAEADNSTQIGQGTNYTANSVQFGDDNIYKKDTHTLTVNNAQVNGNDVYGVIKGEGAPTTATAGKIGQVYQDTTNDKRYFCTYSADTYGWQEIQNKMTQSLTSLADGSEVIVSGDVLMQRKTYVGVTGTVTFTFGITFDTAFLPIVTNATFVNLTNSAITVNVGDTAQNIVIGAIGIKKS